MRVLMFEEFVEPYEKEIGTKLEDLQRAVKGSIEQFCPFPDDDLVIICNEESKINGMQPNMPIMTEGIVIDYLFGPFFICSVGAEDFEGLTDEQLARAKEKVKTTEKEGIKILDGIAFFGQYIDTGI